MTCVVCIILQDDDDDDDYDEWETDSEEEGMPGGRSSRYGRSSSGYYGGSDRWERSVALQTSHQLT
jgi:hypothetical protein